MKKTNGNLKEDILIIAKAEFFKKGFKNASMRNIALKAEVGLGNIYNYYRNKNEILIEILIPLLDEMDTIFKDHSHLNIIQKDIQTAREDQEHIIEHYVDLILRYNVELELLLFKSSGSTLENFREAYTDRHTMQIMTYMNGFDFDNMQLEKKVVEFFVHTLTAWWFSILGEIVSHNLNEDQIMKFVEVYMDFVYAGWKNLLSKSFQPN